MKKGRKRITFFVIALVFMCVSSITIYAEESKLNINGKVYEFDSKDHYEFSTEIELTYLS